MATLSEAGTITEEVVTEELGRLRKSWERLQPRDQDMINMEVMANAEMLARFDRFDLMQLRSVIDVCRKSHSLSDAGRKLFNVSRETKAKPNDADRLKKYLARFGLEWAEVTSRGG